MAVNLLGLLQQPEKMHRTVSARYCGFLEMAPANGTKGSA
ncbi:hypothetical protein BJ970_004182 [Saccharopolyspora phatthalungensis]|uniref:Uncharacterized protein n=1 Tax=Saccharopolyspora phatthalungensis TaxID=664693 RepID=A0A840QDC9_9PSEU|nr:hypothetical protein [Saccharopolyspora phatthalungensis]